MWRMIRAEFSYVRFARIVTIIPAIIVMTILIYKTVNVINLTMYMSTLIIVANIVGIRIKEKRSNREVLLPLKRKSIAAFRSSVIVIPSLTFLLIGIPAQLIYTGYLESWYDSIYELMMMLGVVLLLGNIYLYLSDLYSITIAKGSKLLFNSISLTVLLVAMIIIALSVKSIFNSSFISGVISIIVLLASGSAMTVAAIKTYNEREILTD